MRLWTEKLRLEIYTKDLKTNLPKDKKESEEKKQKTNIIIYTDDAEFIFYNVSGARVKSGDKVEEGTELGSVQGNGQEIAYAKRKETLDKDDKDDKRYYDEAKYLEKRDEDNEDARTFTRNVDKKGRRLINGKSSILAFTSLLSPIANILK